MDKILNFTGIFSFEYYVNRKHNKLFTESGRNQSAS